MFETMPWGAKVGYLLLVWIIALAVLFEVFIGWRGVRWCWQKMKGQAAERW